MKPSLRLLRQTLFAFVVLAGTTPHGTSEACNEPNSVGLSGVEDGDAAGFLVSDFDDLGTPLPGGAGAGGCPVPACSNPGCTTVNPNTPFKRLAAYESTPIFDRAGCFGIAKRDANFYVQLTLDGPGNGIHRHTSTDGGITWTQGPVVIAPNTNWWAGIKCPDPHFLDTSGNMVVYFKGSGSPGGIARAVSTDDGLTWTADPAPVLTSGVAGYYVDNPSVLRRGPNSWMMAYTFGCAGPGVTGPFQMAETHIAVSSDGINWTKSPLNPAITTGSCGAWDQGAVANPVLMSDPHVSSKIHLFYTGADWTGTTTRGCAKIGHAISTNNGRTWCKTGVVLDRPDASSPAWDTGQYMVSSYTIEPGNVIRMYYWAQGVGTAGQAGLGIAEANWPLAGCGPIADSDRNVGFADLPVDDLTELLDGSVPFLRSLPNPTTGHTRIEHNLAHGRFDGHGSVRVFDVRGREIAEVWSGRLDQAPTAFVWEGEDRNGSRVSAGRYLIRLEESGNALATSWVTVMSSN